MLLRYKKLYVTLFDMTLIWPIVLVLFLTSASLSFNVDVSQNATTILTISMSNETGPPIYAGYKMSASISNNTFRLVAGAPKYEPTVGSPYLSKGLVIECTANVTRPFVAQATTAAPTSSFAFTPDWSASLATEDSLPETTFYETTTNSPTDITQTHLGETTVSSAITSSETKDWISPLVCKSGLTSDETPTVINEVKNSGRLGATLLPLSNSDNFTVCAPGRRKKCRTTYFSPGVCFTGELSTKVAKVDWNEIGCFSNFIDLMYVVDSSGSISTDNFNQMKTVLSNAADQFKGIIGEGMQVGILQYGDNSASKPNYASFNTKYYKSPLRLGDCSTVECIKTAINTKMNHLYSGNTFTALAIERAVKLDFKNSVNNDRSTKVLVLITDGLATDFNDLPLSYNLTQQNNITVYAIGVGNKINIGQLRASANGNTSSDRVSTVDDFGALSTTLRDLIQTISSSGSEGQNLNSTSTLLENSMFGFSSHETKDGSVLLGAVGAYYNLGTWMKTSPNENTKTTTVQFDDISASLVGSRNPQTLDSYMGYALSSGNYEGNTTLFTMSSSPRYLMTGAVVAFDEANTTVKYTIEPKMRCNECQESYNLDGSYFGGSLLTADFNNDGFDDLLVGAPLYIGNTYDEGRVFAYLSQGNHTLPVWSSSYIPDLLQGSQSTGGRFGTSMAIAGDLNRDGYTDVVISAPMADDGKGAVYIYHGSSSGLINVVQQRITPSDFGGANLLNFGLALERGIDLDGNLYPDLIIGAPASDKLVLLRSRPVVHIQNTLTFNQDNLDILQCMTEQNKSCMTLKACFSYDGLSVENSLELQFNLTIDKLKRRLAFKDYANTSVVYKKTGLISLTKAKETCQEFKLFLTNDITDFDSIISASMVYSLPPSHLLLPISSVEAPMSNNATLATVAIAKTCGVDNTCQYDLVVSSKIGLPKVFSASTNSSLDLGNDFIVASDKPVTVNVNISNQGENAYGVQIFVTHTTELLFQNLRNITSSNPKHQTCVRDMKTDQIRDGLTTKVFRYEQDSQLKSIMRNASWCYFEFDLSPEVIKKKGNADQLTIEVIANTSTKGFKNDVNDKDNIWKGTYPIKYRTDFTAERTSIEPEVVFNFTQESEVLSSVYQIGVDTPDILMEYQVSGNGFVNIPNSKISLKFPSKLNNTDRLLYLYKVLCVTIKGVVACVCDQTSVNPLKLELRPVTSPEYSNNSATIRPTNDTLQSTSFECGNNATNKSTTTCEVITCNVTDLGAGDSVKMTSYFRLWTQTLKLPKEVKRVTLTSGLQFKTIDPPVFINDIGKEAKPKTAQVITTAIVYEASPVIPQPETWWIYVLAVAGSVLILAAIIAILWKVGFFNKQTEDVLHEQWQNAQLTAEIDSENNYSEAAI